MKSAGNSVEASLSEVTSEASASEVVLEAQLSRGESTLLLGAFFTLAVSLVSFTTL